MKTTAEQRRRDALQNLFDKSFLSGGGEELRESYKKLRNLELKITKTEAKGITDISFLAQNISAAADILVSGTGKCFIYCGNEVSPAAVPPKHAAKALLCLMSNAYLYGEENLVTVKTLERKSFVTAEVVSGGRFRFGKTGSLAFVRNICALSGGSFLIKSEDRSSCAVMSFPKAEAYGGVCPSPDFLDLLSDRLSPLYTEFFGCGHSL